MRTVLPEGRRGRALAVALLLGLSGLAWIGVATPLLQLHADRAEAIAQRRVLVAQMQAVVRGVSAIPEEPPPTEAVQPLLLRDTSDAVAAAALQEMVRDMAAHAGAALLSVETLPAAPIGEDRRIGLRIALAAPWAAVVDLLQAVEQARPRVIVDELELRQTQFQSGDGEVPLGATFAVYAFRRDDGGGAP